MKISEIKKLIECGQYIKLSDDIAINDVYKINVSGNLETDGYEFGYLYIPVHSGIQVHKHVDTIERYKLIDGTLSVNGENMNENICLLGQIHNIDVVDRITIIEYCKIAKEKVGEYTPEIFDTINN